MKIIFFGTSPFAASLLNCLLQHRQNVVAVVTRPDKPKGRSLKLTAPPVKEFVQQTEIPVLQPVKASTPEFAAKLKTFSPDLFIVAAYGEILKTIILDIPRHGAINVHASILPKYRGAAPIHRAIMNGDSETGVTIMKMVLELDAGDILETARTPISDDMTFGELSEKLSIIACDPLIKVVHQIKKGPLHSVPQDLRKVTIASKITSEETVIQWNRPAPAVHNQIRALSPFPGAWSWVQAGPEKKRLKIRRSEIVPGMKGYPAENLIYDDQEWIIGCEKEAIRLLEVQLEGKKSLTIKEFLRGHPDPITIIA